MNYLASFAAASALSLPLVALPARAQNFGERPPTAAEQQESDYRVLAARCGTPAFEKGFLKQSRAMVGAGLVVAHRDPAEVERRISALRRNPLQLVATSADCPARLDELRALQQARSQQVKGPRPRTRH